MAPTREIERLAEEQLGQAHRKSEGVRIVLFEFCTPPLRTLSRAWSRAAREGRGKDTGRLRRASFTRKHIVFGES